MRGILLWRDAGRLPDRDLRLLQHGLVPEEHTLPIWPRKPLHHRDVRLWRRNSTGTNLQSMKRENVHLGDRVQLLLPASRPSLLRPQLVRVDGTVIGFDEPGRPSGVRVALDYVVSGLTTWYATCGELRPVRPDAQR